MKDVDAQPIDKLASLDAQAVVGMLARWYVRQAQRDGFILDHITARNAAIRAVFGGMPDKPQARYAGHPINPKPMPSNEELTE